jgi:hypothetical protein
MMPLAIALLYAVQAALRLLVISESVAPAPLDNFGVRGLGGIGRQPAGGGLAEAKRFPALVGEKGSLRDPFASQSTD